MINQLDKDGNRHGPWEEYWPSGAIKSRGEFKNGIPHGLIVYYYISGELDARCNFKAGRFVLCEFYHKDGRTWMKGEYKNAKRRGFWYVDWFDK